MSKVEEKHALIIAFIELQLHRLKFEEKGELFNKVMEYLCLESYANMREMQLFAEIISDAKTNLPLKEASNGT